MLQKNEEENLDSFIAWRFTQEVKNIFSYQKESGSILIKNSLNQLIFELI